MVWKVLAVIALVTLPFSFAFWYRSHKHPSHHRYDLTLYKSLWVSLQDGVCDLELRSMPTRTGSRSEFRGPLSYLRNSPGTFWFSSVKNGPYRDTRLVFPFWLTSGLLMLFGSIPVVQGPVRRTWRRWHGWCVECGYDLRGTRSERCSECGTRFR